MAAEIAISQLKPCIYREEEWKKIAGLSGNVATISAQDLAIFIKNICDQLLKANNPQVQQEALRITLNQVTGVLLALHDSNQGKKVGEILDELVAPKSKALSELAKSLSDQLGESYATDLKSTFNAALRSETQSESLFSPVNAEMIECPLPKPDRFSPNKSPRELKALSQCGPMRVNPIYGLKLYPVSDALQSLLDKKKPSFDEIVTFLLNPENASRLSKEHAAYNCQLRAKISTQFPNNQKIVLMALLFSTREQPFAWDIDGYNHFNGFYDIIKPRSPEQIPPSMSKLANMSCFDFVLHMAALSGRFTPSEVHHFTMESLFSPKNIWEKLGFSLKLPQASSLKQFAPGQLVFGIRKGFKNPAHVAIAIGQGKKVVSLWTQPSDGIQVVDLENLDSETSSKWVSLEFYVGRGL